MAQPTHPTPETLRRFARVTASRRENREVVTHLLGGCRACSALIASCMDPYAPEAGLFHLAAGPAASKAAKAARRGARPLDFRLRHR